MRRYETTFIVNPQADDAAIDRQVAAVTDLIKADGGKILHEHRMGTRRLAYPIAGQVQGFYASIIFDAEGTVLPRLDRLYKLEEPYIRYLTIRFEGRTPDEIGAAQAAADVLAEDKPRVAAPEAKAEVKPAAAPEPAKEAAVETKPPAAAPAEPKPTEAAEPPTDRPDPADEEL